MGRFRRDSQAQGDRPILAKQSGFLGGMNLDIPSSEIDFSECSLLENLIPFRTHLEARPGIELYGNLSGAGTVYSLMYHKGKSTYVLHRGTNIYYSTDSMVTWSIAASVTTYPDNLNSDIIEYGDDVLIFQENKLLILELRDSIVLRKFNSSNPTTQIQLTNTVTAGTGNYKYRYLYTYARIVDDVLIAESGSRVGTSQKETDYLEAETTDYISESAYPAISSFTAPTGTSWTHIKIYRTLDIGPNGVLNGNNPEAYYLTATLLLDGIYTTTAGIGTMIIGGSPPFKVASPLGFSASDQILISNPLLKTRGFIPIPSGLVGEVTPSFIFVSKYGTKKVYYSSYGDVLERAGYYYEATQFFNLNDGVNALVGNPDTIVALCNNSTYRTNLYTQRNIGNSSLGESISQLEAFTLVDENIGVNDSGSIAKIDFGRFIAHCSDSTIRIWNYQNWGNDLAKFKVSKEIRRIVGSSIGVYHPDGYYILWYRDNSSDEINTKTLRLGLVENVGSGWCYYNGDGWTYPNIYGSAFYFIDSDNRPKLICVDDSSSNVFLLETYDAYSGSNLERRTVDRYGDTTTYDIETDVIFKELTGSSESFFCIHQESHVYLRPYNKTDGFLSGLQLNSSIYSNDDVSVDETINDIDSDGDVSFTREITGKRISLRIQSNKGEYIIAGYDTRYRVQDRSTVRSGYSQNLIQLELNSNMFHWFSRTNMYMDRANGSVYTATGSITDVTDPIGRDYAKYFSSDSVYYSLDSTTDSSLTTQYSGDFSISFWINLNDASSAGNIFQWLGYSDLVVTFDKENITFLGTSLSLNPVGTGPDVDTWVCILMKRIGGVFYVYQDYNDSDSEIGLVGINYPYFGGIQGVTGKGELKIGGGNSSLFDARFYSKNLSLDSHLYYRKDILENEGKNVLALG